MPIDTTTTKFGLPISVFTQILATLQNYPEIEQAKIFGSRAKGSYKRYSDIDIAIYGPANSKLAPNIKYALEDLDTVYYFDIEHYEMINHQDLKQEIDNTGVDIYKKSKTLT